MHPTGTDAVTGARAALPDGSRAGAVTDADGERAISAPVRTLPCLAPLVPAEGIATGEVLVTPAARPTFIVVKAVVPYSFQAVLALLPEQGALPGRVEFARVKTRSLEPAQAGSVLVLRAP